MSELELKNVSVELRGRKLLNDVSLRLDPGELIALVGPNGAGKTSLLRAALGLLPLAAGDVRLGGRALEECSPPMRAASVAWLPQHAEVREPFRAIEVVSAGRYRFAESRQASERAAERALERVGMQALKYARFTELSGGERQRVRVATLLAQEARLLLLDEPANHLDPGQELESYRLLAELWQAGLGILLVTHDINLLFGIQNWERVRIAGMRQGSLSFDARLADDSLPQHLSSLFGLGFESIAQGRRRWLIPKLDERDG
ncbi:MAG: ABC transporter ATP-binding protein [Myxococcota bacterium]